jgi:hypothetical protein
MSNTPTPTHEDTAVYVPTTDPGRSYLEHALWYAFGFKDHPHEKRYIDPFGFSYYVARLADQHTLGKTIALPSIQDMFNAYLRSVS